MARPRGRRTCGIYAVRCLVTGHIYIGSSLYVEHRLKSHLKQLRRDLFHNKVLQFAWQIFPEKEFIFEILEECPEEMLQEREAHYISSTPLVFNILKDGRRLAKPSAEVRKKLSHQAKAQHKAGKLGRQTWRSGS